MKPLVSMSASGSPENNLTVFPLFGKSLIEQKKASTTTLPERTADTLPPFIETCLVKESCVGDTEYHAPTIRSLTSACTDAQILRVG